jgi:hypothetical protein
VSHSVADARYRCDPVFAEHCGELRGFAAKISQTVEKTVKNDSFAHAHALRVENLTAPVDLGRWFKASGGESAWAAVSESLGVLE